MIIWTPEFCNFYIKFKHSFSPLCRWPPPRRTRSAWRAAPCRGCWSGGTPRCRPAAPATTQQGQCSNNLSSFSFVLFPNSIQCGPCPWMKNFNNFTKKYPQVDLQLDRRININKLLSELESLKVKIVNWIHLKCASAEVFAVWSSEGLCSDYASVINIKIGWP